MSQRLEASFELHRLAAVPAAATSPALILVGSFDLVDKVPRRRNPLVRTRYRHFSPSSLGSRLTPAGSRADFHRKHWPAYLLAALFAARFIYLGGLSGGQASGGNLGFSPGVDSG
jgi:hypothetical protein